MNIKDLFAKKEDEYLRSLILFPGKYHVNYPDGSFDEEVRKLVSYSPDEESFIEYFLGDDFFKGSDEWYILMQKKRPKQVWYAIRAEFGDSCFKTSSDAGGVKIGNDAFHLIVPNGYGDGETRCAIVNKEAFGCRRLMQYFTQVSGDFNVYSYDCGDDIAKTLNGNYHIYFYEGLVAFVK